MPKKVRQLKSMLRKAGFHWRLGRGSHTNWWPARQPKPFSLSGKDGSDAKPYQEREVEEAIRQVKESR